MHKNLAWIAISGLSVGVVFSFLGVATGADSSSDFNWVRFLTSNEYCTTESGLGSEETEIRLPWDGGDSVVIAVPSSVYYRGGDGDEVIVRGAAKLVDRVRIDGDTIEWSCKPSRRTPRIDITLPGEVFESIVIAGSSRVSMENVDQTKLDLVIAGSGSFDAQGASDRVSVTIAGSGDANLAKLSMAQFDITIAGSGDAEAGPTEEANITIAGSGDVTLLSRPDELSTSIMGSGRIIQPANNEL